MAGRLLAESPFATQIRADIASIRSLLLTMFFSCIGRLFEAFPVLKNPEIRVVLEEQGLIATAQALDPAAVADRSKRPRGERPAG